MNLSKLFGSKCRAKILERFLVEYSVDPEAQGFFIRELSRELDEQLNSVRRELQNLEELGILRSAEANKKKVYRIDAESVVLPALTELFRKTYDPLERLGTYLKTHKGIELVTWGAYLRRLDRSGPASVVDIFIIGELDRVEFNNALERIFFGQRIKYAIMSKEDFMSRLEYHDKLVLSILTQS
jgi:Fe2+ or Zn2+ uptake regulation protein